MAEKSIEDILGKFDLDNSIGIKQAYKHVMAENEKLENELHAFIPQLTDRLIEITENPEEKAKLREGMLQMFSNLPNVDVIRKLLNAHEKLLKLAEQYTHTDCLYRSGSENAGMVILYVRGDDDTLYVSNSNLNIGKRLGDIKSTEILPRSIKSKVMVEELVKENKESLGNIQFDIYHVYNDTDILSATHLEEGALVHFFHEYCKTHPGLKEKLEEQLKYEILEAVAQRSSQMPPSFCLFGIPVKTHVFVNPELDEKGNLNEEYFRNVCPKCEGSKEGCTNYLNAKKLYNKK